MSVTEASKLERLIRQAGEGWMLDVFTDREEFLLGIHQTLARIDQIAFQTLGAEAPRFSEDKLIAEFERNPSRVRAFLQALTAGPSPQMLLMAWRIMQGLEIAELSLCYVRQISFSMQVRLESIQTGNSEVYESQDVFDLSILRKMGAIKLNDSPVIEGFFPRAAVE